MKAQLKACEFHRNALISILDERTLNMTGMMKAVVKTAPGPGAIELRMVPIPQIGPRDVLVKVKAAAVCTRACAQGFHWRI